MPIPKTRLYTGNTSRSSRTQMPKSKWASWCNRNTYQYRPLQTGPAPRSSFWSIVKYLFLGSR